MAEPGTFKWERGGFIGDCDIPDCHNDTVHRKFYYPTFSNGDAECMASLCDEHKEYKGFENTEAIINIYKSRNE
jgi:hypothetical protein